MYLLKCQDEMGSQSLETRVVKTPKLQFIDSGLLAMLMDVTVKAIGADKCRYEHVPEGFEFGELLKNTTTTGVLYDGDKTMPLGRNI